MWFVAKKGFITFLCPTCIHIHCASHFQHLLYRHLPVFRRFCRYLRVLHLLINVFIVGLGVLRFGTVTNVASIIDLCAYYPCSSNISLNNQTN
jgi:hypothetical protein